ncbi:MAG: glycosyltransferase [Planctomycetes bacterium]|nr:glycosyltransferase [Planctomycetota bacterium]
MNLDWLGRATLAAYFVVLTILCIYGAHRYFLLMIYLRVRRKPPALRACFRERPRVTLQLPMFNEQYVAQRVIERACRIDYPRDCLQIQVLDDSTDDTVEIARATVERMRAAGHDIVYVHRDNRAGYKAGALEAGTESATGEFIAIFDADFLPPERILRDAIDYFTDERVGAVQTRWEHLNRDSSLLTQAQAILLDGHFVIEHTARNRSGRYMSFNGTAGIWRKDAIVDAGGWQHDTLTEDLDLSYRAQLRGWKFVFLPNVTAPAELPPEMNAFKAQQHRWTKGGAQTCLKLLPKVLLSPCKWWVKVEAFFHLTSCFVYIFMVLLTVLIGPALLAKLVINPGVSRAQAVFEFILFVVGFGSVLFFYIGSQRELMRNWFDSVRFVPALMAVGMGIALNNAVAAIEGFLGHQSEFVRTPKFGDQSRQRGDRLRPNVVPRRRKSWQVWAELGLALYLTACVVSFFFHEYWVERVSAAIPFVLVFIVGYFYVAFQSLYTNWQARQTTANPAT